MGLNLLNILKPKEKKGWKDSKPTELAVELVKKEIVKKGTHILDLGCGFGRNSNYLAGRGAVVDAIDIDEEGLNEARKRAEEMHVNVNYIKVRADSLPFSDSSFDVVLDGGCTHMCNKEVQDKVVREIFRVLKKGGYLQYFGFSKEHPVFKRKPQSSQFRDLEDIEKQYGEYFEILEVRKDSWKDMLGGYTGLNILMRRKEK
jgi:ubiquinone/menaquinone biosynthesis C-methylase UbiE